MIHFAAYLAMSLAVLGTWLAVALAIGAWYFWPIVGGGVVVVSHALGVRSYTRNHPVIVNP